MRLRKRKIRMRARPRRDPPTQGVMFELWKDFLRVYGKYSKRQAGRNIFCRSSYRLFHTDPFDKGNLEAGLVLADALEERGEEFTALVLSEFIRSIDQNGWPRSWQEFRDAYSIVSDKVGQVPSGGYE